MKYYVLFNPKANNGMGRETAETVQEKIDGECVFQDITEIIDYKTFFEKLPLEDEVIICGGDGTLNRFINQTKDLKLERKLVYYASGSGNDFLRDVADNKKEKISLNEYLCKLPSVKVQGKEYLFINGVGYGIDGYCCEEGDRIRAKKTGKKINYTGIAIKGLLFKYKPTGATVIVDGEEHRYKKVWLAPTMYGRYYGGGMLPAPNQRRDNPENKLSTMVFHDSGKLKTLLIFPGIFKGEHIKKTKNVEVLSGHKITVKYDEPRALQIDGETILNVSEYTATSANT